MSKLLDELLGSSDGSNESKGFVFFNDENVEGYISKADFLASLRKQKASDKSFRVDHLKSLFDSMSLRRNFLTEPNLSNDDGEEIIWVRFGYGNTRLNLQILNQPGMFDFIKDYAVSKIKNVPNFGHLIKSISED